MEIRKMATSQRNVAVFVGSLRKGSFSGMTANALRALAPKSLNLHIVDIGRIPFYNPDLEADAPAEWTKLREKIAAADAVLFVTPEYNRSVPAALKNAIDVASRPYGKSAWDGKPGAVVSVSPGAIGGFGANHHLRQSLVFLNVPAMQQPEAYIGNAESLFDKGGNLVQESARKFLLGFLDAFARWIELHKAAAN
jgi:chromate reductase, NAD(P)H dehydrogenase (quinone)